jgi:hypothetical protein
METHHRYHYALVCPESEQNCSLRRPHSFKGVQLPTIGVAARSFRQLREDRRRAGGLWGKCVNGRAWGVTTRKPAFGVILLGLLCEQCSTLRPDRLDYPHSRPFRRRRLRCKADYAWQLAASVRLQIAKPLRMSATGLRSQGSGEIDS